MDNNTNNEQVQTLITNEKINELQQLLHELTQKQQELQKNIQDTEFEIRVLEKEKETLNQKFLEELGTDDPEKIKEILQQKEYELIEWIEEAKKLLLN